MLVCVYKSTILIKNIPSQWLLLCVKLLPAFIQIIVKKNRYLFYCFYGKHIVTNYFCVSTHKSYCFLENCKFHLVLIGICLSQIVQRLDKYVYIYQEIDCLYTLFKHRFYSSIVTSSGEMFNQLSRVDQHLRWKGAKKIPSIAKKRHWLPRKLLVQLFWI